MIVPAHPNT